MGLILNYYFFKANQIQYKLCSFLTVQLETRYFIKQLIWKNCTLTYSNSHQESHFMLELIIWSASLSFIVFSIKQISNQLQITQISNWLTFDFKINRFQSYSLSVCPPLSVHIIIRKYNCQTITMKKHFFPMQILILFLFSLECIFVLEAEHKKYFWLIIILVSIISYVIQGARPYTPVFFGIAISDYFQFNELQKIFLLLSVLLVYFIKFYHISIVGKGPFNSGYRYYNHQDIQLSIFYPSTSDGQHPKWIPSERYNMVFYDIAHVDPTKFRIPYTIFNFLVSYLIKIKMPVLGDASLYINDHDKKQRWNVVVFSHGLGSNMNNYSSLCGWWASHGYIVISIQHHNDLVRIDFEKKLMRHHDILQKMFYNSRNADLIVRAREMETVIDQLIGNNLLGQIFKEIKVLQIDNIYFAGHSFGGSTILETFANMKIKNKKYQLIRGLICLDAWFFPLSQTTYQTLNNQNILLLNSQSFFSIVPTFYYMQQKMGKLRQTNKDTLKAFMVKKTDHLSTSDFVFAMGNLFKIMNTVKLQDLAVPIIQFHQIVISLFMQGKSIAQIMQVSNKYANDSGLIKHDVCLLQEWRYVRQ